MRGSLNNQIMAALKQITKVGHSRHQAKIENEGRSPFIHSVGTLDKTFQRLRPLAYWLCLREVRNLEDLNSQMLCRYLDHRLEHHQARGNCRKTFQAELSALMALGRALSVFSQTHRKCPAAYDFSPVREIFARQVKNLSVRTSSYVNRSIQNPMNVISRIESPKHKLMARLQWEAGCRAEGVGAPQRGHNPLLLENFANPETGERFGIASDPVTGQPAAPLWTKEKGGKTAYKYCSPGLSSDLELYFKHSGPKGLSDSYHHYLKAVNDALVKSGEAAKGRGTHGFRYAFAQRRYSECLRAKYTDEQAKYLVSQEMSHNRADITETYL